MGVPRLVSIELTYGCHNGRFEFPVREGPVVVLGPNGAGKTTLMEALVLTLYGIDLRKEPARLEARVPWQHDECRAIVVLEGEDGRRVSVERNFRTQGVIVRDLADGHEEFRGDASPAAVNSEASRYRRWLADHLGLEDRSHYENTACVNQGELVRTRLGEHLLLLAAGGHRDVTTALADIESAYYELTQEPLVEGDRRRLRGRRLEEAEEEVAALEERLTEARHAQSFGEPIIRERRTLEREQAICGDEIERLAAGLPVLVQRRTSKEERDELSERIARLEALQREVAGALLRAESSQQAWSLFSDHPQLPEDFRERAAALQELWPRRTECQVELAAREADLAKIEVPPVAMAMVGCAVAIAAGLGLGAMGLIEIGAGVGAVGLLAAVGFALWRRAVTRRWQDAMASVAEAAAQLRELEDRVQRKTRNMPDAATLGPETLIDRQRRFETERKARQAQDDARRRLADTLARAVDELYGPEAEGAARASGGSLVLDDTDRRGMETRREALRVLGEDTTLESLAEHSKRTEARIGRALISDRNALAAKELELRRVLAGPLALPAEVPAEADAVEAALLRRQTRRDQIAERLVVLERELWERGRASENPVALETQLKSARRRWADCAKRVEIDRLAHTLVSDAYAEFHLRDQERLLRCISEHLTGMTGGVLGPLEAGESLETVRIRGGGRLLPLESPPLSYGEFHAALLAVRLGAADFLAGTGVRPPFLVDEPFTHLDEERSASVWRLLGAIARDRQVIVATQDRLVLDALHVAPDLVLERAAVVTSAGAISTEASPDLSQG